ncbi:dimethylsulfonioproprionate lyase family protein [Roseovarius sp. 2305UL8-3]|uniref:dimethylsulfonioproprionate lyase family protein n=1 Tax=Roseovarius conchicola TaxID=3121636 RepID=UPI003528D137
MTQRAALDTLLQAAQDWQAALPEMAAFTPWPNDLRYVPRAPHALPHLDVLHSNPGTTTETGLPLRDAVLSAAPFLEWRHTYTEAEVGRHYLDNFGWFELAGPEGHFETHQARVTFGYWGPGLFYPRHQHGPEELYSIVSGRAIFHADGETDAEIAAQGTRLHQSNQPHAMTTTDDPILTMVLWRGAGLAESPRMSA